MLYFQLNNIIFVFFFNGCYWLHIAFSTIIILLVELWNTHLITNIFFNKTYIWHGQCRARQLVFYKNVMTLI